MPAIDWLVRELDTPGIDLAAWGAEIVDAVCAALDTDTANLEDTIVEAAAAVGEAARVAEGARALTCALESVSETTSADGLHHDTETDEGRGRIVDDVTNQSERVDRYRLAMQAAIEEIEIGLDSDTANPADFHARAAEVLQRALDG